MKTVIFKVIPQKKIWDVLDQEVKAFATGGKGSESISFDTSDELVKFLSGTNLEILSVISRELPKSITELAKLLNKDKSLISKKVKKLELYGLVTSVTQEIPGKIPAKKISAVYDKIIIEFEPGQKKSA